ncbi:unnamed protein product [Arctia plantaginis]|uniref:Pheromone binding protein 3 n=1 Tax=Arctia plantaginis TaxID=874455 RepID=A0A8S1AGK1_ARCPL|nr:unnamed protein product [Arctia plantaginis]
MAASRMCWSLILLAISIQKSEPSTDVMKYIGSGFVKVYEECKHELNLSDHILGDLFHFWKLEYDHLNRDTGCMIICMSKKLDLIDASGKLHHGNAKEFAMKHGAGEEVASKLVSALHECETKNSGNADGCLRALEIAKCFRSSVHDLEWSPKVEYIVEEVLTEV